MEETLLRVLIQFLTFMNDYEGLEFDDQDILRQYEELTVLLESMPADDRIAFHDRFSVLVEELDGDRRSAAADFLDGLDLVEDAES